MAVRRAIRWLARLAAAAATAAGVAACAGDLSQALEDVKANAPDVCKSYCERSVDCRWDPRLKGDDLEEEAFGDALRLCILECAWRAGSGGYVLETEDGGPTNVIDVVGGAEIVDALSCFWEVDVYRCTLPDEGQSDFGIDLDEEEECVGADACVSPLEIDFSFAWDATAASCAREGNQFLDVSYFDLLEP